VKKRFVLKHVSIYSEKVFLEDISCKGVSENLFRKALCVMKSYE